MATPSSYLPTHQFLKTNEMLVSENKAFYAQLQPNGSFAVHIGSGPSDDYGVLWASPGGDASGDYYAIMQGDGNFVIYKGVDPHHQGEVIWAPDRTAPAGDFVACLSTDGDFYVQEGTEPSSQKPVIWQTHLTRTVGERLDDTMHAANNTPYPAFTGYQSTAYQNINQRFRAAHTQTTQPDIRKCYANPTRYVAPGGTDNLEDFLNPLQPPEGLTKQQKADWQAVRKQLLTELGMLSDLFNYDTQARINSNSVAIEVLGRFPTIQNVLDSKGKGDISSSSVFGAISFLLGLMGPEVAPAKQMLGLWRAATAFLPNKGNTSGTLAELATAIQKIVDGLEDEVKQIYELVYVDWAKLQRFEKLFAELSMNATDPTNVVKVGNYYEEAIYQQVLPSTMAVFNSYSGLQLLYQPGIWTGPPPANPTLNARLTTIGVDMLQVTNRFGGWSGLPYGEVVQAPKGYFWKLVDYPVVSPREEITVDGNNRIQTDVTNIEYGYVQFLLKTAKDVTWKKEVKVLDSNGNIVADLKTQDDDHADFSPLLPMDEFSEYIHIEIWKGKAFDVPTQVARALFDCATYNGTNITLTWLNDN